MENTPNCPPPGCPLGKKEMLFGIGLLCAGLLLMNSFLFYGCNLGFALGLCLCILLSCGYLLSSGHRLTAYPGAILALCVAIGASFARADDGAVKFVLLCFLLIGCNLALCILAGKNRHAPGSAASLADAAFALFNLGFGELPQACRSVGQAVRFSGPAAKKGTAVVLGLGIALPVLLIIVPLLIQADAAFEGLLQNLPELELGEVLVTLGAGFCFAFVMHTRNTALHSYVNQQVPAQPSKGVSPLTVNTVLGAVCTVYAVYLLSQLAYFSGGFSGILPEGFTLANYARRGFFEMAWLCAIDLGLMILALSLSKGKDGKAPLSTRLFCLFIGLVTLFFVAAASAKMLLYIESYGLTRLRVLTQVVMVFLAAVTVLVCLWLFVPRLPYMKAIVLLALAMGAAVSWADVDTQVAGYNVRAYLDGRAEAVDISYLETLGDGAVPWLAELAQEAQDADVAQCASDALARRWSDSEKDIRAWNYAAAQAWIYIPIRSEATGT